MRAATQGLSVSESNCHPFSYERLSFVHNGEIANWKGKFLNSIFKYPNLESFENDLRISN